MGVSINGGYPQNRWFQMENPNLKLMMTGGIPISGNPHIHILFGGLKYFLIFHIVGIIIPIDFHISFSEGLKPPTRYCIAISLSHHYLPMISFFRSCIWPCQWGYPQLEDFHGKMPSMNGRSLGIPPIIQDTPQS